MSINDTPLTGVKKRQQIADTRKQVFIWVALASAAVVICLMVGINLVQRIIYQGKVNGELSKTEKIMHNNTKTIDDLIKNIDTLKADRHLTLPNLKSDESTVFQVVIDALPTEDDSVALSSSLQQEILSRSGITIEQISVEPSTTSQTTTTTETGTAKKSNIKFPTAQPISFRISFTGSYDAVTKTLENIEKTIRPITIQSINMSGSDDKLSVTIEAITYYSKSVNFTLGTKEIPYEEK